MHRIEKDALFLIDGSYILYRSYYGLRPLYTSDGTPTQATYGFCRTIKKLMDEFEPTQIVLVWDSKGPTFRTKVFAEYKATREAPPSDLFIQKEQIQQIAKAIGLCQAEKSGYEADDLIASLTKDNKNHQTIIVGPDKDLYQLLSGKNVMIYDSFKNVLTDEDDFKKDRGFPPSKLQFYHSLLGDATDNIPGVKGIGKKGATDLVKQFDSLKDLYKNLDKVKSEKTKRLLQENKEDAFLSYDLFGLEPVKLSLKKKDRAFDKDNWINAAPLFKELEFETLLKELEKNFGEQVQEALSKPTSKKGKEVQQSIDFSATIEDKRSNWTCKIIGSYDDLKKLIEKIKEKKLFSLDTETTGLKPLQDDLVGLSIALDKKTGYFIPLPNMELETEQQGKLPFANNDGVASSGFKRQKVIEMLKPVLENSRIKKILHHSKFDQLALYSAGIELQGVEFDTLLAANLLRKEWQKINLKELSSRYLNEKMTTFKDLLGRQYKNFSQVPLEKAAKYAAHDALQTHKLQSILQKDINKEKKLKKIFETLEMPLMHVLFEMEKIGIEVDVSVLKGLASKVNRKLKSMEGKITAAIKHGSKKKREEFNVNSPKQVERLLFDDLKLPVVKKSGKGQRSTDQEVLNELSKLHPIPGLILKYRELFKLQNTYIEPLQKEVNPNTGRVHTSFSQTMVATGRLSSSNPNLQNVPATPGYGLKIRSAFVAPRGRYFLSADYSQMELRVLAHMTKDKNLTQAFIEEKDIHTQTAAQLLDVDEKNVSHEQRQIGKRINFSIIYGLTPYGLAKDLGIKPSEAKTYIEKYFEQYPKVAEFIENVVKNAKKDGFVETLMGRRRYIPGLKEKNRMLYEASKRIAVNTPVQGSSAEIMKMAMIDLAKAFESKKLNASIILQIHDELLIEFDKKDEETVEKVVKKSLENVVKWEIPFKITARIGKNWEKVTK